MSLLRELLNTFNDRTVSEGGMKDAIMDLIDTCISLTDTTGMSYPEAVAAIAKTIRNHGSTLLDGASDSEVTDHIKSQFGPEDLVVEDDMIEDDGGYGDNSEKLLGALAQTRTVMKSKVTMNEIDSDDLPLLDELYTELSNAVRKDDRRAFKAAYDKFETEHPAIFEIFTKSLFDELDVKDWTGFIDSIISEASHTINYVLVRDRDVPDLEADLEAEDFHALRKDKFLEMTLYTFGDTEAYLLAHNYSNGDVLSVADNFVVFETDDEIGIYSSKSAPDGPNVTAMAKKTWDKLRRF